MVLFGALHRIRLHHAKSETIERNKKMDDSKLNEGDGLVDAIQLLQFLERNIGDADLPPGTVFALNALLDHMESTQTRESE